MTENPVTFDDFWAEYPVGKKVDKPVARRAWKRALKGTKPETIIAAIIQFALAYAEAETPRHLIPNPATWLNGARWEDDVDAWVGRELRKKRCQRQEAEALAKRTAERADDAMTPLRVKALAEPIAKPLPDEACDAAWKALPPAERKALREEARGQGQFRLSWGIGERIAKDKWCTKQSFGKGN